ncbi:hypothetical protein HDU90_009118 [Geranomyces variabilis]|nr:hypothetical protein HDU90_009118 [Geranomyces variabilis]
MPSDKETLLDMGFSAAKVTKALQQTRNAGLQPAMDWLISHAEDPDPTEKELAAGAQTGGLGRETTGEDDFITADQATAQSLKCDDCGRLLRDATAAEAHAARTSHHNFSESTEAIKPLTEEEKKAKLAEIHARLAAKREERRLAEIEENKGKEKVRRATGQQITEAKEKAKEKEMMKALEEKRREKEDDKKAREKIKREIELDKQDRARAAAAKKQAAMGLPATEGPVAVSAPQPAAPARDYDEARLQIRMPDSPPLTETFRADDTLEKVYAFLATKRPGVSLKLLQTFPRKVLDGADRSKTLKELNLTPSAALVAQQ